MKHVQLDSIKPSIYLHIFRNKVLTEVVELKIMEGLNALNFLMIEVLDAQT